MPREIEVKSRLEQPAAARARLAAAGAQPLGRVHEENLILDSADGTLRRAGCALRVRIARGEPPAAPPGAMLAFKGPRAADAQQAGVADREELEFEVGDPAAALALLARLGYHPRVSYQKRRETWHLAGCTVALDELPELGWFAEIEGPDAAAVAAVESRLGLDPALRVRASYVELTARHGRVGADGACELRFDAPPP